MGCAPYFAFSGPLILRDANSVKVTLGKTRKLRWVSLRVSHLGELATGQKGAKEGRGGLYSHINDTVREAHT